MAEVKVNELPPTTSASFSDNDHFLIVDDGNARLLSRPTLQAWVRDNVQGEKGEQGVKGNNGKDGVNGVNGANGKDGLSAYQVAVANGYTGTQQQWLQSLVGATGSTGSSGLNGWSPVLKTVTRGNDVVLQISDWNGGSGTKPSVGQYLSSSGLVTNINNADNVRGLQGIQGSQGVQGEKGLNGVDGKAIKNITFNTDSSISITFTDNTLIKSSLPLAQYGWATYKDSQYIDTSFYNIPANTQVVIPNNATNKIESLPSNVTAFYNATNQKYLLSDSKGFYSIRVRFKVASSSQQTFLNLSMSKDTTEIPYNEDKIVRGDNIVQNMQFETVMYGDSALSANGLTIRLKTYERSVDIYNIEVTIAKLI